MSTDALELWIEHQYHRSIRAMLRAVSPQGIVKQRLGFGRSVRGARGAVVASPVLGDYDPQPDYFFHWFRDSALVIDALRLLYEAGDADGSTLHHVADFVQFSASLGDLDGRRLVEDDGWRGDVAPGFVRYLRTPSDLAAVHGWVVSAEARVNADGSLDISRWNRPQYDGPPLRALTILRWLDAATFDAPVRDAMQALLRADLDVTRCHWRDPSYDIWEEELGRHYYNLRIAAAALAAGARWLETSGDAASARQCRDDAGAILETLDSFWLADAGYYRSRFVADGDPAKALDIAVILAAIHAGGHAGMDPTRHTVGDARMHATLARLEAFFDQAYPINRNRAAPVGVAMGRYPGDVYYSGGAYYFSTLGAAEFCFRAAACADDPSIWALRGDRFLNAVRVHTPADGMLSEQYDQCSGAPASAAHLAWSYAAFISCRDARRRAVGRGWAAGRWESR